MYGGMHTLAGFLKISHEKFWGERFGTDFGVKFGYAHVMIKTDKLSAQEPCLMSFSLPMLNQFLAWCYPLMKQILTD